MSILVSPLTSKAVIKSFFSESFGYGIQTYYDTTDTADLTADFISSHHPRALLYSKLPLVFAINI